MNFSAMTEFLDYLTSWRIPGCSLEVYRGHERLYKYSSGYADCENHVKMTGDELMFMYSATKTVTATAGMQLVEKGKMHLNDPLEYYMPEFSDMRVRCKNDDGTDGTRPAENQILVKHLFSMTAGFGYDIETPEVKQMLIDTDGKCPTREFARCYGNYPLLFEPGTHWDYSVCHDILGALIETVSGERYSEYARKNIFEPCAMVNTTFGLRECDRDRLCVEYIFDDNKGCAIREPNQSNWFILGPGLDSGGAGIVSTVGDFALFADCMACGGISAKGERIISPRTIELLKENQLCESAMADFTWEALRGFGYGLGMRTLVDRAAAGTLAPLGEFGWTGAAGAFIVMDTENQLSMFYAHHMLNNQETFTTPRLRNILYSCLD